MATLLNRLENELSCSICLQTYTNPKQLQCQHVYCEKCLAKLVIQDQQAQPTLPCPKCRRVIPVPANGVADFNPAIQINSLLEIVREHKKVLPGPERDSTHNSIRIVCSEHDGEEVKLYCETCEKPICWKCIMNGERHHSHTYEEVNEAFLKYKKELTLLLEPVEKRLATTKKALAEFGKRQDEISDKQANIEAEIHETISQIHKALDSRENMLVSQLNELTQAKLKSLDSQREHIETTQAQLSSCLLLMRENLKTNNQADALLTKANTIKQVKELTTTLQPDILQDLNTDADMIFTGLDDLCAECQNSGRVSTASAPDPFKCTVTGEGMDTAVVGEKSTVMLKTLDFNSQPCEVSVASISCALVSDLTGRDSVERKEQNKYEISYQPTIKGRQHLHVKVKGQHISGSPFPVSAHLPVELLGTPILTIRDIERPHGVAVNQRGELFVNDGARHSFSKYSPCGEIRQSFGTHGFDQGQFQDPFGLALDEEENILITDCDNNRIQKFTRQGEFIMEVGTPGKLPLQFWHPRGVAVNHTNNRVYVVDGRNCRIQILNPDLSYSGQFGREGHGEGELDRPRHIACDSTGNMYVADCNNHRIQVFTAEGKFLRMFKASNRKPYGIAIDSSDRVYVSEREKHCISVYTSEGQLLKSFGSCGNEPGKFKYPGGLAVDSSGVVYVCDCSNHSVHLF